MTSTPPSPNCGPREPRSRRRSPTSAGAWWPRSACPTARSFPSTSPSILRRTDPAAPAPLPSPSRSSVRGMTRLRVLFIGGSGVISSACSRVAVDSGIELFVLNRGRNTARPLPAAVNVLQADIREPGSVRDVINDLEFDAVVDWVAFTAGHVRTDIDLFRGRTGHYVFISSASAYQTPPARLPVTESTPLGNPFWQYSRDKIACEELLVQAHRRDGFPVTIVRPSHTYDPALLPLHGGWTVLDRMRRGLPVLVHGDGTSLWTLTHHRDFANGFVGLLGHASAIGDTFHITSDEALSWNQIHELLAGALRVKPTLVHVPSEVIAAFDPRWGESLLGDKAHSM